MTKPVQQQPCVVLTPPARQGVAAKAVCCSVTAPAVKEWSSFLTVLACSYRTPPAERSRPQFRSCPHEQSSTPR